MHDSILIFVRRRMARLSFGFASLMSCGYLQADVTLHYQVSGQDCIPKLRQLQLASAGLRMDQFDSEQGGEISQIFAVAEQSIFLLRHGQKQFMRMDVGADAVDYQADVLNATGNLIENKLAEVNSKMREAMAQANPTDASKAQQMQAQMMQMMNGAGNTGASTTESGQMMARMQEQLQKQAKQAEKLNPEAFSGQTGAATDADMIVETGRHTSTSSGECTWRTHMRGKQKIAEYCVMQIANVGLSEAEQMQWKRMFAQMSPVENAAKSMSDKIMSSVQQMPGVGETLQQMPQIQAMHPVVASKDDEIIVEQKCYADGSLGGSAKLSLDHAAISDERFNVPANYAEQSFPQ
jgi:hypothetical protein